MLMIVSYLYEKYKLAGMGKALGQSIRDFKKEIKSDESKKEEPDSSKQAE